MMHISHMTLSNIKISFHVLVLSHVLSDLGFSLVLENILSRHQLEDVIAGILEKQPHLEEDIRQHLPKPDMVPMEERLNNLKRNIFRALPNNRLESKTDAMAYSRVAIHLLAFKKDIN